jgi:hypothetical protein
VGYLLIEFEPVDQLVDLCAALKSVPGIELHGDWHDFRLDSVKRSGLTLESAPALSVFADKQKHGEAFRLSLALRGGDVLEGQIRKTGLLLCNTAVDSQAIENDPTVALVTAFLGEKTMVMSVELA